MSWREAVKRILDKDSIEREIINLVGLRIVVYGILLLVLLMLVAGKESPIEAPKDQGAVRQPVRPTCTKRSCKLPWDVPKLSGEGSGPDSKPEN